MRAAIVDEVTGTVLNVIEVAEIEDVEGVVLCPEWIDIGDNIDKSAPEGYLEAKALAAIPIVESITMRQARLQLLALGVLDDVSAAIDSMGAAAKIEWEYAATVEKPNQLTTAMMQILEFDEEMTNQFFYEASLL